MELHLRGAMMARYPRAALRALTFLHRKPSRWLPELLGALWGTWPQRPAFPKAGDTQPKPPQGVRLQLLFAKCSWRSVHKALLCEISAAHLVHFPSGLAGDKYEDQASSSFSLPFGDDV